MIDLEFQIDLTFFFIFYNQNKFTNFPVDISKISMHSFIQIVRIAICFHLALKCQLKKIHFLWFLLRNIFRGYNIMLNRHNFVNFQLRKQKTTIQLKNMLFFFLSKLRRNTIRKTQNGCQEKEKKISSNIKTPNYFVPEVSSMIEKKRLNK